MQYSGFSARVTRIRRGQQWSMDGIRQPKFQGRRRKRVPLTQRPGFRFGVLTTLVGGVAFAALDPTVYLPEAWVALLDPDMLSAKADQLETRARTLIAGL